ncbi:hypothetical protein OTU49_004493 [Cherax quadricarinatus]|uniref:Uncharacterized protein n=2 Tax=Cherax quadricarinatus TaxID=27406 RepID=A0AAW0XCJ5_CHEQU
MSQSRWRKYNFEDADKEEDGKIFWSKKLLTSLFADSVPLIDTWLSNTLRSTGAWQWDSTLPFNLANIHECKMIKDTSYFGNPIYSSHWTMCTDIHHASFETNANELQMIFNYLCNPYLTASQQYCCSEQ